MDEIWFKARFRRDHRWAPARMSAYLDEELAGRPRNRMQRHLGECTECRRLMNGLSLIVAALHQLRGPQRARDAERIVASVRIRISRPPR